MISPVQRQWVTAALAGLFLFLLVAFLPTGGTTAATAPSAGGPRGDDGPLLLPVHRQTLAFIREPARKANGRGLFATDFFKPPPAPPPVPKPQPPATRTAPLVYRGFAEIAGGQRLAYVEVDGTVRTLAQGDAVLAGWVLDGFDSEAAQLAREGARHALTFNRKSDLTVPAGAK